MIKKKILLPSAYMHPSVPAHFATKNKQISVAKGKQVHVQCNVQGDNPIDIKWKIQNTQQHLDESLDARLVLFFYKKKKKYVRGFDEEKVEYFLSFNFNLA